MAQARAAFRTLRGIEVFGPYVVLSHAPDLMLALADLGARLRRRSTLPAHVRELAILMVAAQWRQRTEWALHEPDAREAGLTPTTLDQIARREKPAALNADAEAAWTLLDEAQRTGACSDAAFEAVHQRFGEAGTVELAVLAGFYTMLALVMNVAGYELDDKA